jgi:hypothetical protein
MRFTPRTSAQRLGARVRGSEHFDIEIRRARDERMRPGLECTRPRARFASMLTRPKARFASMLTRPKARFHAPAQPRALGRWSKGALGRARVAGFFLVLCTACSVRFDADRQQCASSEDCAGHGFAASTCVEGLCQPLITDAASSPATIEAGTGVGSPSDASIFDASPPADGNVPRGDANPAPDADTAPCQGPTCPECVTNDDCVRRGIVGGTCADSICWPAPKAECTTDAECVQRGPEYEGGRCLAMSCRPNPRWRCERQEAPQGTDMRTLRVLVRDSISLDPMPGVRALACQKLDLQCAAPVTEATTNAEGDIVVTVPGDFAGYLQIQHPRYFPAMYFLPAAYPADGRLQPFPLLASGIIGDVLAIALGSGLDAERGHMMLISEDCLGAALPGVAFKSPQQDMSTVQFYVQDLLPSTDAKQTAEAGNGGYLNFPPGTAMISVAGVANNLKLATVSVVVRPGFISVAYIRPETR